MSTFSVTKHIEAPISTVFDVATDLQHAAEHVQGIEKIELLTPGAISTGTRWRETRKMMGREHSEVLEIKAFDRPNGYIVGCESCGCYFETTFTFTPSGNGTKVTLDVRTKAVTLMAKLLSPIGNLMIGSTMRKCLEDDLDDVKRVSESRRTADAYAAQNHI